MRRYFPQESLTNGGPGREGTDKTLAAELERGSGKPSTVREPRRQPRRRRSWSQHSSAIQPRDRTHTRTRKHMPLHGKCLTEHQAAAPDGGTGLEISFGTSPSQLRHVANYVRWCVMHCQTVIQPKFPCLQGATPSSLHVPIHVVDASRNNGGDLPLRVRYSPRAPDSADNPAAH